jgi:hypothetical protein
VTGSQGLWLAEMCRTFGKAPSDYALTQAPSYLKWWLDEALFLRLRRREAAALAQQAQALRTPAKERRPRPPADAPSGPLVETGAQGGLRLTHKLVWRRPPEERN